MICSSVSAEDVLSFVSYLLIFSDLRQINIFLNKAIVCDEGSSLVRLLGQIANKDTSEKNTSDSDNLTESLEKENYAIKNCTWNDYRITKI